MLKLTLDCDPDAAWRALQSPAVLREVAGPLVELRSLKEDGFPTTWEGGQHRVAVSFVGMLPLGEQIVSLDLSVDEHPGVRILRDRGHGASGLMAMTQLWDHRMAISAHPSRPGKTLYRDRLIVRAGVMSPAVWPSMWGFWQLRAITLRRIAPYWAYDPNLIAERSVQPTD